MEITLKVEAELNELIKGEIRNVLEENGLMRLIRQITSQEVALWFKKRETMDVREKIRILDGNIIQMKRQIKRLQER